MRVFGGLILSIRGTSWANAIITVVIDDSFTHWSGQKRQLQTLSQLAELVFGLSIGCLFANYEQRAFWGSNCIEYSSNVFLRRVWSWRFMTLFYRTLFDISILINFKFILIRYSNLLNKSRCYVTIYHISRHVYVRSTRPTVSTKSNGL